MKNIKERKMKDKGEKKKRDSMSSFHNILKQHAGGSIATHVDTTLYTVTTHCHHIITL